jgi:quercetin dioxygenase-like cupin family protein
VVEIREGERISGVGSTEPHRRSLGGAGQGAEVPASPAPEQSKSGGAGFAGAGAGTGDAGLGVTLLVDLEQIGVVEVRSEPGGITPPLHLHARHAELFFVLEGELTVRLEDRELRAGSGTWVYIPSEVVHTFLVTGDSRAHFLDFHVPSCGFGDFVRGLHTAGSEDELRAVRVAFDQQAAPEYATGDPSLAVVRRTGGVSGVGSTEPPESGGAGFAGAGAGAGERITDRPRRRATLLVEADEVVVSEFFYGPGERGAKPHVHHHHADAFLVVEGEISMTIGASLLRAPAETLVVLPPNVVHGFDNDGMEHMLAYNFHMPASGFADYLRGRNPDFDQHDPPADGGADPASAIAVRLSG